MMMIKKLKMWRNPGYTEECIEIPPIGSRKLPAADWVNRKDGQFYDLRPRKGSTLSKIELPLSFSATWDMSYLWMQAEDDAGTIEVFGWIRSVEQIAGSEEAVRIMWVPDYWRTCSGSVSFGRGVVTKSSDSTYKRPLSIQPRAKLYVSKTDLNDNPLNGQCVIFTYTMTDSNGITQLRYGISAMKLTVPGQQQPVDGLIPLLMDSVSFYTGIPSSSILGAWVCNYPAYYGSYFNSSGLVIPSLASSNDSVESHAINPAQSFYWISCESPIPPVVTINSLDITTDDIDTYRICGPDDTPYMTIPYGLNVKRADVKLALGSIECYYKVYLSRTTSFNAEASIEEGLYCEIPLISIPVSSAALSDYYITGQREFDIESRRINQEKALVSGLSGVAGTALNGALTGALLGSAGGPIGAAGGAAIGLGVGILGNIASFGIEGATNDRLQNATDKLYANQANTLIVSGTTADKLAAQKFVNIIKLEADATSKAEITAFVANQGYDVEIPVAAATSFMTSGPLQIRNLNVTGSVPPAAKTAIKAKLEAGVFIVENNPSGTDPAN